MTLRHLECAIAAADAGSINKAAKKLLVSQPYLSGMINSLEKELGYSIFVRSAQGIRCTAEGSLFLSHADVIMSEITKIHEIGRTHEIPLRIAAYYSKYMTEQFLEFHNSMRGSYGDRYREMGNMEVIEAVSRRDYSLGIIYHARSKENKFTRLAELNNLEYRTLFERMGTYLIMSASHPLAGKDRIVYEELRASDIVFFDDVSTMLYMVDHLKLPESATDFSVSDRGAFMDALRSGRYISIINTPFPEKEHDFVLKDVADCMAADADFEVGSAYIFRKDHRLTEREKEFINCITEGNV